MNSNNTFDLQLSKKKQPKNTINNVIAVSICQILFKETHNIHTQTLEYW